MRDLSIRTLPDLLCGFTLGNDGLVELLTKGFREFVDTVVAIVREGFRQILRLADHDGALEARIAGDQRAQATARRVFEPDVVDDVSHPEHHLVAERDRERDQQHATQPPLGAGEASCTPVGAAPPAGKAASAT